MNFTLIDSLSAVLGSIAGLIGFTMPAAAQSRPLLILQIYRDFLEPGSEAAYSKVEEDAVRICAELKCPHPYLAIESLSGQKEVWFFNGYAGPAEQERVAENYKKNTVLLAALAGINKRKRGLTGSPVNVFADYRRELSHGVPWSLGQGRFLVIEVTQGKPRTAGTVFEAADGTKFIVSPARTRSEADEKVAGSNSEARVFAVRPDWSLPSAGWVASDPEFWRSNRRVTYLPEN